MPPRNFDFCFALLQLILPFAFYLWPCHAHPADRIPGDPGTCPTERVTPEPPSTNKRMRPITGQCTGAVPAPIAARRTTLYGRDISRPNAVQRTALHTTRRRLPQGYRTALDRSRVL
jgi:hypothetical protein